ncbi:MAG: hypothetical protein ACFB4I_22760 [Cyanophyceae cyanobacterium]
MNHDQSNHRLPAPCIIESGTVVNKEDIRRLLSDLGRVHYLHTVDGKLQNEGDGWLLEVFCDPQQATIVTNGTLYINVQSFDYLQLHQSDQEACFDLVQDSRLLRLIPLSSAIQEQQIEGKIDEAALEAMVTKVLSARWDVQLDDDDCPF